MARARRVLPVPGGPTSKHALGNAAAELLEFLRIFQEIDDFVEFFLGLVNSSDVFESGFLLLRRKQARAGFPEAQRLVSAGLHLLHHENPEEHEKNQRSKIDEKAEPVCVLHFFVAVEDAVVLEGLGDIWNRGVGDRNAAEFSAFAIFALQFGAIRREVDGDVLHTAVLNLGEEVRVVRLVLVRGLAAGGRHAPQDNGKQDHQEPKKNCADCRVHLNYLTLFRPVRATPQGLELVALPVPLPTARCTANYLDAESEPAYSTGGSVSRDCSSITTPSRVPPRAR